MRWQSLRVGRVASYTADISGRSASLSSVIGIAKSCLAASSSSCTISNSSTWRVTVQPGGGDSGTLEKSPTGTRASRASDSQAWGICNASAPCTAISGGKRRAMPSTRAICDWCVVSALHAGLSRGCICDSQALTLSCRKPTICTRRWTVWRSSRAVDNWYGRYFSHPALKTPCVILSPKGEGSAPLQFPFEEKILPVRRVKQNIVGGTLIKSNTTRSSSGADPLPAAQDDTSHVPEASFSRMQAPAGEPPPHHANTARGEGPGAGATQLGSVPLQVFTQCVDENDNHAVFLMRTIQLAPNGRISLAP